MLSTGGGDDHSTVVSSTSVKRGQFPYAYLKSKLSTLPEELSGTRVLRAESVSQLGSSLSEVGSKQSSLAPSQRLKMLAIRRKKSQSLADLHHNSNMVMVHVSDKGCGNTSKHEESGYDSDTRKSAETVSPKSSDKSDESDSAETSGSFTSGDVKDSDEEDTEPHYQTPRRGQLRPVRIVSVRLPMIVSTPQVTPQKPPRRSKGQGEEGERGGRSVSVEGRRSSSAGGARGQTLTQKNFKVGGGL